MKILKKLLIGLGAIFLLLVLVVGSLVYLGSGFKGQHEPFVRQFMSDYSRHWDVADVNDRLATEFLEQIQSPNGVQAVASFRRLGKVVEITDLSLENFYAGTGGQSGVFVLKARFEAAPAVIRLSLRDAGDGVRVLGLHVTPLAELPALASSASAI